MTLQPEQVQFSDLLVKGKLPGHEADKGQNQGSTQPRQTNPKRAKSKHINNVHNTKRQNNKKHNNDKN